MGVQHEGGCGMSAIAHHAMLMASGGSTSLVSARYWRLRMLANSLSAPDNFAGYQGGGGGWFDASNTRIPPTDVQGVPGTAAGNVNAFTSTDPSAFAAWDVGAPGDFSVPLNATCDFTTPVTPTTLKFAAGGSPYNGRNPTKFEIAWSTDNSTWNTIQTYTGVTWASGETKTFTVQ